MDLLSAREHAVKDHHVDVPPVLGLCPEPRFAAQPLVQLLGAARARAVGMIRIDDLQTGESLPPFRGLFGLDGLADLGSLVFTEKAMGKHNFSVRAEELEAAEKKKKIIIYQNRPCHRHLNREEPALQLSGLWIQELDMFYTQINSSEQSQEFVLNWGILTARVNIKYGHAKKESSDQHKNLKKCDPSKHK